MDDLESEEDDHGNSIENDNGDLMDHMFDTILPLHTYKGESYKGWKDFTRGWDRVFEAQPWTYNSHRSRIVVVASYLRDTPSDLWEQEKKNKYYRWDNFKQWLRDQITSKEAREQDAFEGLGELRQEKGESVQALYSRMCELEDDCPRAEGDRVMTLNAAVTNGRLSELMSTYSRGRRVANVKQWLNNAQRAEQQLSCTQKRREKGSEQQPKANNSPNDGSKQKFDKKKGKSDYSNRCKKKEKSRKDK
jgi:hypothetical protein